jgi:hypothetical protein
MYLRYYRFLDAGRHIPNLQEEYVKRTFKWLWLGLLAGLFVTAPSVFAWGQEANQASSAKKINAAHRQEVKAQHQRLKQSGKDVRAEALSAEHAKPPKATRHQVSKAQQNPSLKSANLQHARKENRSRQKVKHQAP